MIGRSPCNGNGQACKQTKLVFTRKGDGQLYVYMHAFSTIALSLLKSVLSVRRTEEGKQTGVKLILMVEVEPWKFLYTTFRRVFQKYK
jgi:hypothetical protein